MSRPPWTRPDLGDLGLCGILNMYEQLMALRYQENPVILIRKEKGESQRMDGVEDDKVVCDLNDGTTWHISHDNGCTRTEVTQLGLVCGRSNEP